MKTPAEKLLEMLESQAFSDFYQNDFESYLTVEFPEGHRRHISKEMILERIQRFVTKHGFDKTV